LVAVLPLTLSRRYIEDCPEGSYCRGGDVAPTPCSFFQTCPARTSVPQGTVQWMLGFLATLWVVFQLIQMRWSQYENKKKREKEKKDNDAKTNKVVQNHEEQLQALLNQRSFKVSHNVDGDAMEKGGFVGFRHLTPDKTSIGFEFQDLSLVLNNGQRIIDRVSGKVETRKMTAIMGPSGCGKTTMLNVLRDKAAYERERARKKGARARAKRARKKGASAKEGSAKEGGAKGGGAKEGSTLHMCGRAHVRISRPRRRSGGFGGSPPESLRFGPLLPQRPFLLLRASP
jgi:hypothetical protein